MFELKLFYCIRGKRPECHTREMKVWKVLERIIYQIVCQHVQVMETTADLSCVCVCVCVCGHTVLQLYVG